MPDQPEIVHTVSGYYDGPRSGIADFHGRPHAYESLWDVSEDDWSDAFLLQPIEDAIFILAIEDWAIWKRWDSAFHNGQTTIETHPALPDDRARYEELKATLEPNLALDPERAIRVRGIFTIGEAANSRGSSTCKWVVEWLPPETAAQTTVK